MLAACCAAIVGCGHKGGGNATSPPSIPVSLPVQKKVTDYAEYTGRTAAIQMVTIIPRATGNIVKIPFKEGSEVKKGDLLFEIDPRPYQAAVDQAKAQVGLNQAQLALARANYQRDLAAGNAVTKQQLDIDLATVDQDVQNVKVAEAILATAQLNLDFCSVASPIDGRVSYYFLTLGNMAIANQTQLTTVVSQDPMYAYFDADEHTVLQVRDLIREGKFHPVTESGIHVPVFLGLANDEGYPHKGDLDFANNIFTATTATLRLRGVFDNPKLTDEVRLISPGMFVRVKVPISAEHPALLVSQAAIANDQNVDYVLVVNEDNKIERKDVKLGALHEGLQVITEGLNPTDRVAVSGLQHLREGTLVEPKLEPMPTPPNPNSSETQPNVQTSIPGPKDPPAPSPKK
jgi:multidrug efflux system membrane fusion protein